MVSLQAEKQGQHRHQGRGQMLALGFRSSSSPDQGRPEIWVGSGSRSGSGPVQTPASVAGSRPHADSAHAGPQQRDGGGRR